MPVQTKGSGPEVQILTGRGTTLGSVLVKTYVFAEGFVRRVTKNLTKYK